MDLTSLQAFALGAQPTRPARPSLSFDPRWLINFQERIASIGPACPLAFAFPSTHDEIAQLEATNTLQARQAPFYDPKNVAGLFLLSPTRAGQGWYKSFKEMDDLFTFLRSHSSLRGIPTFISAGGQSVSHYYPSGVEISAINESYELSVAEHSTLTLDELRYSLEFFASSKLLNHPTHRSNWWKEPDKYVPQKRAEKNIQSMLVIVLQSMFKNGVVCEEITVPTGRTDVVIEQKLLGSHLKIVMELKALRSFSSSGQEYKPARTQKWCESGIEQVRLNGHDLFADHAMLCAYDLRKQPDSTLQLHIEAWAAAGFVDTDLSFLSFLKVYRTDVSHR